MKNIRLFTIVLCFFFLANESAQAQLWKKVQERAKNKDSDKYTNVLNLVDGAFLEMYYVDNKNSKNNSDIIATAIDKNPGSIKNDDYEWMSY